jgi:S-adenosylmethionine decarboxylase
MGRHLLLEVYNIKFELLNDMKALADILLQGVERAEMTALNVFQHQFEPYGVSVVIALSESHLSLHSWPEKGCVSIDCFTCGEKNPKIIAIQLLKYFDSYDYNIREITR